MASESLTPLACTVAERGSAGRAARELPGGRTRLIQEETFRGAAIPFTKSMLTKTIEPQFVAMNNALAARATGR